MSNVLCSDFIAPNQYQGFHQKTSKTTYQIIQYIAHKSYINSINSSLILLNRGDPLVTPNELDV